MDSPSSKNETQRKEDVTLITEVASAASSHAGDEQRSVWQNVKKYRNVTCVTFGITSAILLYGYDYVVVGTVSGMPSFQKDFGIKYKHKWILPSMWLSLWNIASPIGAMIGALFGGWLQDRIGRRRSLALSSFLSAIGVAIMFVSYVPEDVASRRLAFLLGKLFQGGAIGAVIGACQTYMSEILPPALRGSGMALFPAFILLGQLTGALVIYGVLHRPKGYAVVFASQWPFSFVPIIVAFLIPESPAWYVRKRQMDKAHAAQARLDPRGADTRATVEKILMDIEHEEQTANATYMDCFRKGNFRRTFIVIWANSLTTVFGVQLLAKASYFLQLIGMRPELSIVFLILGIVLGLLANIASIWIMPRFERRPLIIVTLLAAAALWTSMGIANCFTIVPAVTWWTAVTMMLIISVCGLGVWPASFAVSAEAPSLQLRAKTQGIGWFCSALAATVAGLVLPFVFNPDKGNLRGKTGFTYAASCVIGAAVSWYLVPDMKGRSVAEIDLMFEEKLATREFKKWRPATMYEQQVVEGRPEV